MNQLLQPKKWHKHHQSQIEGNSHQYSCHNNKVCYKKTNQDDHKFNSFRCVTAMTNWTIKRAVSEK